MAMFDSIFVLKSMNIQLNFRHHLDQLLGARLALGEHISRGFFALPIHSFLELVRSVGSDASVDRFEELRMTLNQAVRVVTDQRPEDVTLFFI